MKAALKKPSRFPTSQLFQEFSVLDVRQLYIKVLLLYGFKNNYSFIVKRTNLYSTRYQNNVGVITPRITKAFNKTNSFYIAHILFQNLPLRIRDIGPCSIAVFKKIVHDWLLSSGREAAEAILTSVYA